VPAVAVPAPAAQVTAPIPAEVKSAASAVLAMPAPKLKTAAPAEITTADNTPLQTPAQTLVANPETGRATNAAPAASVHALSTLSPASGRRVLEPISDRRGPNFIFND
jgi:hypothetical protein